MAVCAVPWILVWVLVAVIGECHPHPHGDGTSMVAVGRGTMGFCSALSCSPSTAPIPRPGAPTWCPKPPSAPPSPPLQPLRGHRPTAVHPKPTSAAGEPSLPLTCPTLSLSVLQSPSCSPRPGFSHVCPNAWLGFQGKCFYFSDTKSDWNSSREQCQRLGASLATVDTEEERVRAGREPQCQHGGGKPTLVGPHRLLPVPPIGPMPKARGDALQ